MAQKVIKPPLAYYSAPSGNRPQEGLQAARKRGRVGGRPPALSTAQRDEVRRMRDVEHRPLAEIARLFKVSTKTVRRA